MKNFLNSVQVKKPNRNGFDLTHDLKLSCNMGQLIPIACIPTVPGDKFNISAEALIRFAPLVSPMMHRVDVSIHYFYVPKRILWDGWEKYITGDTGAPAAPYVTVGPTDNPAGAMSAAKGSLSDYLGVPVPSLNTGAGTALQISAMPYAAYQCIFSEYYRDQNLQSEVTEWKLLNGNNNVNVAELGAVRNRAWEHDYFTAALPFAQKGNVVDIPAGDVELKPDWSAYGEPKLMNPSDVAAPFPGNLQNVNTIWAGAIQSSGDTGTPLAYDPDNTLTVDMATITDLRRAYRLQEWLEKNARGGTRYVESILVHFGVRSSNASLQRPQYITGMKTPVNISEVLNTAGDTLPQGNMSGHGVSFTSGAQGHYFCEEHGYIMGIMSVMPKTAYMQGVPRHFMNYADFTEEFWPEFQHIGEQAIDQNELYAYVVAAGQTTFGYIPRYGEYKFENNRVAGDFRDSLDYWHMGRKFASNPTLNAAFIKSDPTHRVFAVTDPDEHKLYCHVLNRIFASRPMAKYGTPSI